jgi:hypothetical protein
MTGGLYVICVWKGKENHQIGTGFLVHQLNKLSLLVIGCNI